MPLRRLCVRLFSAAVAGLSALPMPLAASVAAESAPDVIRVGVMAYSPPWYDGAFIDETLRYLEWKMPSVRFSVEYASPEKLSALIENRQVDLVASGAAFFMSQTRSLRDLASLVSDTGKSANEGTVAAVIVRACFLEDLWRAGNEDYFKDLRVLPPPAGASDSLVCRHSTRTVRSIRKRAPW